MRSPPSTCSPSPERPAVHKLPALKESILTSLQQGLLSIQKPKIFMSALWILGFFCDTDNTILSVLRMVKESLGELPFVACELNEAQEDETPAEEAKKPQTKQLITADGTYATQSALMTTKRVEKTGPPLRRFLIESDFFLGAQLATVLAKLSEQFGRLNASRPERANRFRGECMYILSCIVHLGKSGLAKSGVTEDDLDRIGVTIKMLATGCPGAAQIDLEKCQESLEKILINTHKDSADEFEKKREKNSIQVDKTISFSQLTARSDAADGENPFDSALGLQLAGTVE